ncbi:hypothetical protein [Sphingomonas faeni]|uniref:hypothetical protein n=1 Tax=Sphingomonas faeni TaxID=185950 RepID=UPI0020C07230|nr:hypothetical protein [Sphingomonas faeni]MCK8458668.1 hypothetical protein [Sphingomonas faeni]
MTNITPFTGWLLQEAVALDDACPGVTVHLLRASFERRHVIAAYLSRRDCFRHFASSAELSRFLMTARHDDILAAAFGAVPVGLRSALSRAGPTPHGRRYYGYLNALHASKARPEMSHLLKTIACTGPKNLRIARALPATLRNGRVVTAIRDEATARSLSRSIDLMESAGADRRGMLEALGKATTFEDIRAWARRWAFKLNFPAHPVAKSPAYTPIESANDLKEMAVHYRNCARSYLTDVLDARAAFATISMGKESAVAHLIWERGRWWLDDLYGRRNAAPSKVLIALAHSHLADHGVLPRDAQPLPMRKWSCLRRFEPPRVCRRPWVVSHAAISMLSAAA